MTASNDELLTVLKEIRDILSRVYVCFEDQYREKQAQKAQEKLEALKGMMTPERERVYPLLFDHPRLSQAEIASRTDTSQPTVSRFIAALLEQGLIEETQSKNGSVTYVDKYDFLELMEAPRD